MANVETQCDMGICYCRNLARDTTCASLHHNLVSLFFSPAQGVVNLIVKPENGD